MIGPGWFYHPLGICVHGPSYISCRSYNFWSGIGSDFGELALIAQLIAGAIIAWRLYKKLRPHLECHEETCHRIGWHKVEHTPHRCCWEHHPILGGHPSHSVPLKTIHARHAAASRRPGTLS